MDWGGLTVLVAVVGVLILLILIVSPLTDPIPESEAKLVSAIAGALVGSVATYFGMRSRDDDHRD